MFYTLTMSLFHSSKQSNLLQNASNNFSTCLGSLTKPLTSVSVGIESNFMHQSVWTEGLKANQWLFLVTVNQERWFKWYDGESMIFKLENEHKQTEDKMLVHESNAAIYDLT